MTLYSWFDNNKPEHSALEKSNKISSKTKVKNKGMWPQASLVEPAIAKCIHSESQKSQGTVKSGVITSLT